MRDFSGNISPQDQELLGTLDAAKRRIAHLEAMLHATENDNAELIVILRLVKDCWIDGDLTLMDDAIPAVYRALAKGQKC